jgi:hypothetical protein
MLVSFSPESLLAIDVEPPDCFAEDPFGSVEEFALDDVFFALDVLVEDACEEEFFVAPDAVEVFCVDKDEEEELLLSDGALVFVEELSFDALFCAYDEAVLLWALGKASLLEVDAEVERSYALEDAVEDVCPVLLLLLDAFDDAAPLLPLVSADRIEESVCVDELLLELGSTIELPFPLVEAVLDSSRTVVGPDAFGAV